MFDESATRGERTRYPGAVIGRNAAWAVVQVIVSATVLFVVYYFVVRTVGVDQVGLLSSVSTTAAAARLSELGLSGAVTRFSTGSSCARGKTTDAAQVVLTVTAALCLSVGLVGILAWPTLNAVLPFILDVFPVPRGAPDRPCHIVLFVDEYSIKLCSNEPRWGLNRADRRAQITLLSQSVFAVAAILLIRQIGIIAIPVAQAMQAASVFLLALFALFRELPELRLARPSFSCFKRIWLFGAHLQLITLLILFYDPMTRLLLNYFGSLGAVGFTWIWQNRLITQVRSLIVSANQVMVPHYANLNITNPERVVRTTKANFQILLVTSTMVFSMLSVSLFLIGNVWLGQADAAFIRICTILIVGYFFNTLSVGIYFMNLGVGAVLSNVYMWMVIIFVNVIGGAIGGLVFGSYGCSWHL